MSKYAYAIAVILLVIGIGAYGHRQKVAGRAEVRAERVLEQLQEVEDAEAHRIARQAEINKLASVAAAADAKARKSDQLLAEQVEKNVPNLLFLCCLVLTGCSTTSTHSGAEPPKLTIPAEWMRTPLPLETLPKLPGATTPNAGKTKEI
jgi:hypothetical protein